MNGNIEYWAHYWSQLSETEEGHVFPLMMINPRTVLREFANEIESNSLANDDNKKFFMNKISHYLKCDPGIHASLGSVNFPV